MAFARAGVTRRGRSTSSGTMTSSTSPWSSSMGESGCSGACRMRASLPVAGADVERLRLQDNRLEELLREDRRDHPIVVHVPVAGRPEVGVAVLEPREA